MRKPKVFIGSSAESLSIADALNVNLDHECEVTVWKHAFELQSSAIESLVNKTQTVDFAIFVFQPDDMTQIRNNTVQTVRDNVIFELGLFIGALGKDRCIILKPRNIDLYLPSDLLGLMPCDFDSQRTDNDIESAINAPAAKIKNHIKRIGLRNFLIPKSHLDSVVTMLSHPLQDIDLLLLNELNISNSMFKSLSANQIYNKFNSEYHSKIAIGLERLLRYRFLDKSIEVDQYEEYYVYLITQDGVNYLLENEETLHKTIGIFKMSGVKNKSKDDLPF